MKRLITILLSFIGCVCVFGQNAPMVVAGKMHVSGTIRSQGAVHVYAGVDTCKIDIDNTDSNTKLVTDTVIFYSNDTYDGLIRNLNTKSGGVKGITASIAPAKVIVRKKFDAGKYTYVTFPFAVAESNVKITNGNSITGGDPAGAYYALEFNAKRRSDSSSVSQETFTEITYADGFKPATGYAIYYTAGGEMDFVTTDANAIDTLFSTTLDKPANFTIYGTSEDWTNPEIGDGWALIGGRNSTTFTINQNTVNYSGSTIYYRKQQTSQATGISSNSYGSLLLSQGESLNRDPYSPFYIQVDASEGETPGQFIFKKNTGLILESSEYRSVAENEMKDRLYFALSSDKDNSFGRFYVVFADNYSEAYKASKDGIAMSTYYEDSPVVWILHEGTDKELVLNGLPMKDERKIRMGFSVPEAGDYTFRLDPLRLTDVRNVILADNLTGKKVDLMQTAYPFTTAGAVKKENSRFVLYINSSYTDIPAIESSKPYAYAKDNLLTIKNLAEGDKVSVYDLAGRAIVTGKVTGKEFSTALNQKGVYVVNVTGAQTSVFKVLNK